MDILKNMLLNNEKKRGLMTILSHTIPQICRDFPSLIMLKFKYWPLYLLEELLDLISEEHSLMSAVCIWMNKVDFWLCSAKVHLKCKQ